MEKKEKRKRIVRAVPVNWINTLATEDKPTYVSSAIESALFKQAHPSLGDQYKVY